MSGESIEKRGRRSDLEVSRLQVTLDVRTLKMLDLIVQTGKHGRNRNDAISDIATKWIQDNVEETVRKFKRATELSLDGLPEIEN